MKILTIVGARPQFIKAAVLSRAIRDWSRTSPRHPCREVILHTGQHYDPSMSQVFFEELELPHPDHHLETERNPHGPQIGAMLDGILPILKAESPDLVVVYGDTFSTLAGGLAAARLQIPVAHVEAGLRSFNRKMPEETNRVLTDHVSRWLFCPTERAVANLRREGIPRAELPEVSVIRSGDVMYDAALYYSARVAPPASGEIDPERLENYILATIHRAESTNSEEVLDTLMQALNQAGQRFCPVVLPLHPRTRKVLEASPALRKKWLEAPLPYLRVIKPLGFLQMFQAERRARLVVTDSGGVQKEAFFHGVPCVTMRTETEWTELVDAGWNTIAGHDSKRILEAIESAWDKAHDPTWMRQPRPSLYGNGDAGRIILQSLLGEPIPADLTSRPEPRV